MEESLGALKEMQDAGKIRHVGLSNVSPEEIVRARKILPIVSVQNQYNIEDRKSEKRSGLLREGEPRLSCRGLRSAEARGLKPDNALERAATGSQRERCPGRSCLASAAIARDAADSWHVVYRAPGRKRRCREAQINSGRVESH